MLHLLRSETSTNYDNLPVIGNRPLFFAAVSLLAGILFAEITDVKPVISFICCGICLVIYVFIRNIRHSGCMILFAVMFASMVMFSLSTVAPISNLDELGTVDIKGRVAETRASENTDTYLLTDVEINGQKIGKGIYLTTSKSGYKLDDIVVASGELRLPSKLGSSFDYEKYCMSKGVAYTCISYDTGYAGHADDILSFINKVRYNIAEKLDELFAEDSAIVKAFMIGMDEEIEDDLLEGYRATGISHILVISGLHVGIIYMAIDTLLKKLSAGRNTRLIVNILSILIVIMLAGFSSAVIRAGVMCAVHIIGRYLGKKTDSLTSLSIAFIICVLIRPSSVFGASMQLSFAAVFGILCMSSALKKPLSFIKSKFIAESLASSIGATMGTFPIIFSMNGSFYLPSFFINLAVIPFCSLLIPAAIVVSVIYILFGGITAYLAIPIRFMINALNGISRIGLFSDFGHISGASFNGVFILLFFMTVFLVSGYIVSSKKAKAAVCSVIAAAMLLILINPLLSKVSTSSLTIVDIGNGDFSILQTENKTILIDTGADEDFAADYLKGNRINPDIILLTEADESKIGGLCGVLNDFPETEVTAGRKVSKQLRIKGCEIIPADDTIIADDVTIRLMDTENGTRAVFSYMGRDAVTFLEDKGEELPYTHIIKLYSNGKRQKYSQKEVFESGAGYAIISSNSEVSEDTMKLIEGLTVLNTFDNGNIVITFGEEMCVESRYES